MRVLAILSFLVTLLLVSCSDTTLTPVSYKDFSLFVQETNYVTDAEKFGWSFIQKDVLNFEIDSNLTWRIPDGNQVLDINLPVTQVSYNDAVAYCKWSNSRLPTYKEYWSIVNKDSRTINHSSSEMQHIQHVNLVGNAWEITNTLKGEEVRLAGGSYLCDTKTCNGTDPNRTLYIDKYTGNTHISFAVIYH